MRGLGEDAGRGIQKEDEDDVRLRWIGALIIARLSAVSLGGHEELGMRQGTGIERVKTWLGDTTARQW